MEIEWKPIDGYDGRYLISNHGQVISLPNRTRKGIRVLKQSIRGTYPSVELQKNNKGVQEVIHRLVAKAFLDNPLNFPVVNHIDKNRNNSHISNLEWCSTQYNIEYSHSKNYTLINPEGAIINIFNMRKFARELRIPHQYFFQLIKGNRNNVYGWTKFYA
jgi:hypothetical protein